MRYYFANIDNKSSVISLSKLLVREKAQMNEANEPRVYLISNSPRQPEMYELAFVSKRHQTNFVLKLKACIEARQKEQMERHRRVTDMPKRMRAVGLSSSDDEDEEEEEEEDEEEEEEEETGGEDEDGIDEGCAFESLEQDQMMLYETKLERSKQLYGRRDDCIVQRRMTDRRCKQYSQQQARRVTIPGDQSEPFDFNIEQDILVDPIDESVDQARDQKTDITRPWDSTLTSEEETESEMKAKRVELGESVSLEQKQRADDDESDGICLASNESGLSELARDSMDESKGSGRPRVRANQRRRRIQRPRNVSNQSSSSSEPSTHRQNISQATEMKPEDRAKLEIDENEDSGRGIDLDDSSASSSADSSGRPKLSGSLSMGDGLCEAGEIDQKSSLTQSDQLNMFSKCSLVLSKSNGSLVGVKQSPPIQESNQRAHPLLSSKTNQIAYTNSHHKQSKERKLSTVSSLSSQVKLFNRLRSSGYSTRGQQASQTTVLCLQCSNQTGACSALMNRSNRRSSLFVPEQKLEELRDIQIQLDKDKQEWQIKFERMQEQLMNERRELDMARERLRMDRQQVANERELLYRKLDVLREKGILLSPSHKVHIITNGAQNQTTPVMSDHPSPRAAGPICTNGSQTTVACDAPTSLNSTSQPNSTSIMINEYNSSTRVVIDHESSMRRRRQQMQAQIQPEFMVQSAQLPTLKVPVYLSEAQGQQATVAPVSQTKVIQCLGLTSKIPLLSAFSGSLLGEKLGSSTK